MDSLPRTATPPAVRPLPRRARTRSTASSPRTAHGGLRRYGLVPVLAASVALVTAGCGGASPATTPAGTSRSGPGAAAPPAPIASGEPTTAGSTAPDAAPSPSGPSAPAEPSGAAGASGSQRCAAEKLTMALSPADAGAGQVYYRLTFTNTSTAACTLQGFPGVSLIQRDGSGIGVPATREGTAGKRTELGPGGTAEVTLHTANQGVSDSPCWGRPDYLKVYPPGSTRALTLRTTQPLVCGGRFTTTAVDG